MLGPSAGDLSWNTAVAKWESGARIIKGFGFGLFGTILQYNSLAVSCLRFVSQFEHVPNDLLRKETVVLQQLSQGVRITLSPRTHC